MQTIFKTAPTSNFTIIANDLISSDMPSVPKNILVYLLSKPNTWQPKVHDLQKQLKLTAYAVRKALRWLCAAGFAVYTRLKTGHTIWRIFDKPQIKTVYSPVSTPRIEFSHVENQHVLIRTETEERKKPLPEPIETIESIVVVDSELIYPAQLNPDQKKAAKHIIKKVKQPELQQPVLFALAYAMVNQKINSVPAYLQGLVTRANNGTFTPVGSVTATNQGGKPLIPLWRGFKSFTPSKPEKAKGFIQQAKQALRGMAIHE